MISRLFKKLALMRISRTGRKLEVVSRRMGLLQVGGSYHIFQTVPGIADMADAGLAAKGSLAVIRGVLESDARVNWTNVADTLGHVAQYIKDAHLVMDHYDKGRPSKDRLFVVRENLKGLF